MNLEMITMSYFFRWKSFADQPEAESIFEWNFDHRECRKAE